MLFFGSNFTNCPLLSVRSSGRIGTVHKPIINPHNLHIDGFKATAMNGQHEGYIVDTDVREIHPDAIIIDDHEDIADQEELVRLQPIIKIDFELLGKNVFVGKKKIGKVENFVIDTESLFVQKLYVQPNLFSNVGSNQLIFDRQSIIEITDTKIVIAGPEQKAPNFLQQKFQTPQSLPSTSASSISE